MKHHITSTIALAILGTMICITLLLSQLARNYPLVMSALFLFSFFASYVVIIHRGSSYLLILVFIAIPLIIKITTLSSLSSKWLLANLDLIYMMKIPEKIVATSHYPFGDTDISTIRPNYLGYPTSFLLQAILSLISGININTLTLFPIASWAAYILILLITLNLVVQFRSDSTFNNYYIAYATGLFMFNFLVLSLPTLFIYSNIIRALIVLLVYMLIKNTMSKKFKHRHASALLMLLCVSIILGHSQEPIMLLLYLALLALILKVIKALRWGDINGTIYASIIQTTVLYGVLFLYVSIFYNISVQSEVIRLILTLISNISSKVSLEYLTEKEEIAMHVLTHLELCILRVALLLNTIAVLGALIRYLKESVSKRNALALAAVIASAAFLAINGLVVLYQGILSDLIFRPFFVLLCSFISIFMSVKSTDFDNQTVRGVNPHFERMIILSLVMSLSFFIAGNVIYSKYHILTSDTYIHESLIVDMLSSLKNLILTSNALHNQDRILIIDTPKYPSYEISRALLFLTNRTYNTIIYLDPEIPSYCYSYLNGVPKLREFLLKNPNMVTTINSCNYLELMRVFNKNEFYVIGEIKCCLQYHVSVIFSVNGDLSLGLHSSN